MDATRGQPGFATTHWSVVLAAGDPASPDYTRALNALCETYWYPLYAYLRRRGCDRQQAEDHTQDFFAALLERRSIGKADPGLGKFRSFLLASLRNFLADDWGRQHARKRGGDAKVYPLDIDDGETRYRREPVDSLSPERLFERSWAQAVLQRAMTRLRAELIAAKKEHLLDHLKGYLAAERDTLPYRDAAAALDMTENAVKVTVHRLRRRYGELVRDEIAQTVATAEQVEEELRVLCAALAG